MAPKKEEILWQAEFNPKVQNYWLLSGSLVLLLSIIGIPLIPFWFIFGKMATGRYLNRMRCTLTTKNLQVVKGIFVRTEKTVPLDKITDLGLVEGPIMRAFGLQAISFETAGQSSAGALVRMTGVDNTEAFREAVLTQRDRVVEALSEGRQASSLPPAASDASVLAEIRDSLLRIESLLQRQ